MSLASLTGLRVGKETVSLYGKANDVRIPHALVVSHTNARQKYQERIDNEKKEKEKEKERILSELQVAKKRKAEEQDRSDYLSKKKRLEDEAKGIRDVLKFHETRRKEFSSRLESTNPAEIKSSVALIKQVDQTIEKKRAELDVVEKKKYRLVETQAEKN